MQRMQRKFGTLLKRSSDEADIGSVLAEFKEVEDMLKKMSDDLKAWKEGWEDVLKLQYDTSEAFSVLCKPIAEAQSAEAAQREPVLQTPARSVAKALTLARAYDELRRDLAQELGMIEGKLLRPVQEARNSIKGLRGTVKHRENMKLDYERYLSRAEHVRKKEGRGGKEEVALAKHEGDLAQAQIDYQNADEQIKETFPPVTAAVKSLLPYLLASQVMLQHTLVAQLYTVLDEYCRAERLPSPAPPEQQIVATFEAEFTPLRKEIEASLKLLATGRAVKMSMALSADKGGTVTGLGLRSKAKGTLDARKSSSANTPTLSSASASTHRPSMSSQATLEQAHNDGENELEVAPLKPPRPGSTPAPHLSSKPRIGSPQVTGGADYFSSVAAQKKKPPPPVPTKRIPSSASQWVTALFDFAGQSEGDLSFREGDRIRVLRKTERVEDWWEGELGGARGSFPANYTRVVVGGVPV